MKSILKLMNAEGYSIFSMSTENSTYYFTLVDDRLFFLTELFKNDNVECLNEFTKLISKELRVKGFENTFKNLIEFEENDVVEQVLDLKAILWDLYVIGIHRIQDNNSYSIEEISKIERNSLLANKIIIEGSDDKTIAGKLIEILKPVDQLDKLIESDSKHYSENAMVKYILYGDSKEKDLESRIKKSRITDKQELELEDVDKYLEFIKDNMESFNIELIGGDINEVESGEN